VCSDVRVSSFTDLNINRSILGKALFYSFLRSNFAEENLQLYDSLEELSALPTFDEKLAKAEEIQGITILISSIRGARNQSNTLTRPIPSALESTCGVLARRDHSKLPQRNKAAPRSCIREFSQGRSRYYPSTTVGHLHFQFFFVSRLQVSTLLIESEPCISDY